MNSISTSLICVYFDGAYCSHIKYSSTEFWRVNIADDEVNGRAARVSIHGFWNHEAMKFRTDCDQRVSSVLLNLRALLPVDLLV